MDFTARFPEQLQNFVCETPTNFQISASWSCTERKRGGEKRKGERKGVDVKEDFTRGGEKSELKVDAQLLLTPPAEIKKQMS